MIDLKTVNYAELEKAVYADMTRKSGVVIYDYHFSDHVWAYWQNTVLYPNYGYFND